ncbi:ABC transporter ATP-binding protein [Arthrobacter sp. TB 23]|uniref:ABC transporter ATP-binding protein n=1 Tax=Arthrobacter sp. TB 23 TaxID=494419 RepID=UPI0002E480D5|nr:ABC transporter ATP-binding protein [Arthrobacter sp. TB 23]
MITYSDVEVRFQDFLALPQFNLTVQEGEFFTLLGPSGCGKTTALRTLAGLITPSQGSISIAGKDVTRLRSDQRELGMVFQNYALFPSMSVFENIAFGLRAKRKPKTEVNDAVAQIAREVDLTPEQLQKNVAELSGGQQQRVAIARSLVLRPKILLLDEPLSNLDAKLRQQLRGQLKDLQRQFGITTVYVTHDQDEALSMSDRIAVLNKGRIEQVGTPHEIYVRSATEFVCTFIGDVNRLTPQLVERLAAAPGSELKPDAVTYLRTERVTIVPDEAGASAYTIGGTIKERSYQGTSSTYSVDCGDNGMLRTIMREDDTDYRTGDWVTLSLHPDHLLQYPDGDQAGPGSGLQGTGHQAAEKSDGQAVLR